MLIPIYRPLALLAIWVRHLPLLLVLFLIMSSLILLTSNMYIFYIVCIHFLPLESQCTFLLKTFSHLPVSKSQFLNWVNQGVVTWGQHTVQPISTIGSSSEYRLAIRLHFLGNPAFPLSCYRTMFSECSRVVPAPPIQILWCPALLWSSCQLALLGYGYHLYWISYHVFCIFVMWLWAQLTVYFNVLHIFSKHLHWNKDLAT